MIIAREACENFLICCIRSLENSIVCSQFYVFFDMQVHFRQNLIKAWLSLPCPCILYNNCLNKWGGGEGGLKPPPKPPPVYTLEIICMMCTHEQEMVNCVSQKFDTKYLLLLLPTLQCVLFFSLDLTLCHSTPIYSRASPMAGLTYTMYV